MDEIYILREPKHICSCGEYLYSADDTYLIQINGEYKYVCKQCYLEHKSKQYQ